MIHVKPEDQYGSLSDFKIMKDDKKIGWIVQKENLGFIGLNKDVPLTKEEKWHLAMQLSQMFHVVYEISHQDDLYELMRKIWALESREERTENLCCCCGVFSATEANGLCQHCSIHCAGFLLAAKPALTLQNCEHGEQG